ncbi:L,D-transpeptidase [Amycolatopsis sp. K13G38]|uniref:L,D-transpeptidase n=1 Tax=Amycolatopsis acididurans TaxID=2724524 RepID=A0ABX1JCV0_9PSEU|nr:Ig-like domain-containing protein [Amycolatopsis acididurans]NKQ57573.1 L,D-transpeptidase [Amycolatopsis acididurans]
MSRRIGLLLILLAVLAGCTSAPADNQPAAPRQSTTVAARPASLALTPAPGTKDVAPGEPVAVAVHDGKVTEVTLTGADGTQVAGQVKPDGSGWESAEPLGYGKSYTVTATATGSDGKPVTSSSTFATIAKPKRTLSVSTNLQDGETVGVGMPLIFTFTGKVTDRAAAERAVRVVTEPATEGAFRWFDDKQLVWRPKEYWKPGTKVFVNAAIYGKNLGGGAFGAQDRAANVTIGDKVVAVADGASHQMKVSVNDVEVRSMPTSMGKSGHNTPAGNYTVMSEHVGYTMDSGTYGVPSDSPGGYRTFVQYAVRLSYSGIFYHSAPWSVGSQGHRNVSHGCLNLSTADTKWLMDLSKKGDIVTVVNSGGPELEPTDGWSVWQLDWQSWTSKT